MNRVALLSVVFLAACSSAAHKPTVIENVGEDNVGGEHVKVVTVRKDFVPHIWSDHKIMDVSPENCALKGESILDSLGFKQVVRNGAFVYGNYISNRAAIKCVAVDGATFVYASSRVRKLRSWSG